MKHVVVGVEESLSAERALDRAFVEAHSTRRTLRVVHAWTSPAWALGAGMAYEVPPLPSDGRPLALEVLDTIVTKGLSRRLTDEAIVVEPEAVEGLPGPVLVAAATDATLLVVGGRGRGRLRNALVGSATSYALHHAVCPLMIVPEHGDVLSPFGQVIVGVDGSDSSRSALLWGYDAAVRHDRPLRVLHAMGRAGELVSWTAADEQEGLVALNAFVDGVLPPKRGCEVRTGTTRTPAARALLEATGSGNLLVVGSRGRGGFTDLLLGSVATQCAHHTESVLVVVRAGEERLNP